MARSKVGDYRMAGVDVVIPCYQYGRYLRECVTSVLSQGVGDLRVLIIDNASTDDSVEVARQLAREDRRVEVVAHRTNVGATASYNEGIEWASADYFVILDADDLLAPGCLARALPIMELHPEISFTYGFEAIALPDGTMRGPEGNIEDAPWRIVPGREYIEHACRYPRNYIGAPTVVRRTSAQKRVGFHRPELPYSDDLEMWLRLATVGSIASTKAVQGIRRVHALQMSEGYRSSMVRDFAEREAAFKVFFANEGRALPSADRLLRQAKRNLGADAYWSAVSHLFRGYPNDSLMLFKFCLTRRPSAAIFPPVGWLFRMHRAFARIGEVLVEAGRRLRASRT
jgi:glycosyltransferase involved in cell wall biosynthesis